MKRCNLVINRCLLVFGLVVTLVSTSCDQQKNGYALRQPSYVGPNPFAGNGSTRQPATRNPGAGWSAQSGDQEELNRRLSQMTQAGQDPDGRDEDLYQRAEREMGGEVTDHYPFVNKKVLTQEDKDLFLDRKATECANQHPSFVKLDREMNTIDDEIVKLEAQITTAEESKKSDLEDKKAAKVKDWNSKWTDREVFADDDGDCIANTYPDGKRKDPDSCVPAGALAVRISIKDGLDMKDRLTLNRKGTETGADLVESMHSLYVNALKKEKERELVAVPDGWFTKVFGKKGVIKDKDGKVGLYDAVDDDSKDAVDGKIAKSLDGKIHLFRGGIDNIGWPSEWGAEGQKAGESTFITSMVFAESFDESIFTAIGPGPNLTVVHGMAFLLDHVLRVNSVTLSFAEQVIPLADIIQAWRDRDSTRLSSGRGVVDSPQVGHAIFWSKEAVGKGGLWIQLDGNSEEEGYRPIPSTIISALPNIINPNSPFYVTQEDWEKQSIIFKDLKTDSPIYEKIKICEDIKVDIANGLRPRSSLLSGQSGTSGPGAGAGVTPGQVPPAPGTTTAPPTTEVKPPAPGEETLAGLTERVRKLEEEVEKLKTAVAGLEDRMDTVGLSSDEEAKLLAYADKQAKLNKDRLNMLLDSFTLYQGIWTKEKDKVKKRYAGKYDKNEGAWATDFDIIFDSRTFIAHLKQLNEKAIDGLLDRAIKNAKLAQTQEVIDKPLLDGEDDGKRKNDVTLKLGLHLINSIAELMELLPNANELTGETMIHALALSVAPDAIAKRAEYISVVEPKEIAPFEISPKDSKAEKVLAAQTKWQDLDDLEKKVKELELDPAGRRHLLKVRALNDQTEDGITAAITDAQYKIGIAKALLVYIQEIELLKEELRREASNMLTAGSFDWYLQGDASEKPEVKQFRIDWFGKVITGQIQVDPEELEEVKDPEQILRDRGTRHITSGMNTMTTALNGEIIANAPDGHDESRFTRIWKMLNAWEAWKASKK